MKIDKCPHCGNDEQFYTKDFTYGPIRTFSRFDGEESDNSGMYDGARFRMGKIVYCEECNKKIARVEDMEVEND